MRAMLTFIGEKFDKACLTFHQNRRYARTASYAQVTEPLYDRSSSAGGITARTWSRLFRCCNR